MTLFKKIKCAIADRLVAMEIFQSALVRDDVVLNGHKISFLKSKTANKDQTFLMIHGFGGDGLNFVRYAKALGKDINCVIPDLLGHGLSGHPWDFRYSVDAHVELLIQLMDALNIRSFTVVGNSLGGHVALRIADKYPDRVKSMILFAPAGLKREVDHWDLERLKRGQHPLKVYDRGDFNKLMANVFIKPPFIPWPMKQVFAERAAANQPLLEKQWLDLPHGSDGNPEMEPSLPQMKMPTLIVWGDRDHLLPVGDAQIFAGLMPMGEVHVVENCGHLPMAERPRSMAILSRVFIDLHRPQVPETKELQTC